MELDLETKHQLAKLLAEPASVTQEDADMLSNLIKAYPYYQPLYLLLAKANINESNSKDHLATASLYNNGQLLYQTIHQPEKLSQPKLKVISFAIKADENHESENPSQDNDSPSVDYKNHDTDEQETFEEIAEINTQAVKSQDEQEVFEEIAEFVPPTEENKVEDEQEIFEEIIEVNASNFPPAEPIIQEVYKEESVTDDLTIENIVATDFFAFEQNFSHQSAPKEELKSAIPLVEEYDQEAEAQTVSKYDDDKLPYTFLWWLAKTRKEHEQIFQPYVTPKKTAHHANSQNPSELQQQYVEHIFHLQTPFSISEEHDKGPINNQVAHRGTDIIDSFIKNEPQIRPPKAEQINTENKAKKSAEDHNDLVSETLAAIYIEQMLYHKAIDTYEKLSLKFPEKSRYFADLIQSLEKKI